MPIYEYQCESCGHRQDALQRMSDAPLVDCAACGQPTLKKLVSAPRFRLKGSGWYETDFKSDNRRNLADGGDGAKADGKGAEGKEAKGGEGKGADGAGKASDSKASTKDSAGSKDKPKGSSGSSTSSSSAAG